MYRAIRNVHLFSSMLSLPFLLMYGLSAMQMAHPKWFANRPVVTNTTVALAPGLDDAREVVRLLFERGAVRGDLRRTAVRDALLEARLVLPGTVHNVSYSRASGEAAVRTERATFIFMLNRLHHIAGMHSADAAVRWWGLALGLVSALLIVAAGTGLYLWFQTKNERRAGAVLLLANLLFSVVLIALMRAQ